MVISKTIVVLTLSIFASMLPLSVGTGICAATNDNQYGVVGAIKVPHLAPMNPDSNAHWENRLDPWTGDVTSNGIIDSDDVQLLIVQVFNQTKYRMTYNQLVYG